MEDEPRRPLDSPRSLPGPEPREAAGVPGERWITIPNWPKFQHYDPAKRQPPWIKVYTELLHDEAYLGLSLHARGVLHGLWLEYAMARRQIRDSTATVSRRLGERVSRATLDSLNRAGFIEYSASAPLALARARTEAEAEQESFKQEQRLLQDPDDNGRPLLLPLDTNAGEELREIVRRLIAYAAGGDPHSAAILRAEATGLPDAAIGRVHESARTRTPPPRNRAGYIVNALRAERTALGLPPATRPRPRAEEPTV